MAKVVPSLSTQGWLDETKDPTTITSKLLSYFVVADHSQSNVYQGNISSLPYLMATYGHDDQSFRRQIESTLATLLGRYFDNVTVTASTYEEVDENQKPNGRYGVSLILEQRYLGQQVNLAYQLENRQDSFYVLQQQINEG